MKLQCFAQAWLQDSVTGGKKKILGAREIYSCEFEKGTGAREIYSSVDQTKKVKTKKKVFSTKNYTNSGYGLEILAIFLEFLTLFGPGGDRLAPPLHLF